MIETTSTNKNIILKYETNVFNIYSFQKDKKN